MTTTSPSFQPAMFELSNATAQRAAKTKKAKKSNKSQVVGIELRVMRAHVSVDVRRQRGKEFFWNPAWRRYCFCIAR